jgi:RNA polymerase sigma-70 factor (ECF subfamily)
VTQRSLDETRTGGARGSWVGRRESADRRMEPRLSGPADEELLRAIAEGDEEAFRVLFHRWAPRLGRFLMNASGSREAAEDLLQETFLRILKGAGRFEPRGSVGSWVYRIAANLAYSHWRRERSRPLFGAEGEETLTAMAAPAGATPEEDRLRRALLADIDAALGRLEVNKRIVFVLKVREGLTYEEIASILCCPVGTVKSRLHHAVHRLQQDLEERNWGERPRTEDRDSHVE